MPKVVNKQAFLAEIVKRYGDIAVISRPQVVEIAEALGVKLPSWLTNDPTIRVGRGMYSLKGPVTGAEVKIKVKTPRRSKVVLPPITPSPIPVAESPVATMPSNYEVANTNLALMASAAVGSLIPEPAAGYVPFGNFNDIRAIVKSQEFYPGFVTGLSGNGKTMMIEQVCATQNRECIRVNVTIETDEDDLIGGFRLIDGRTVWQNGPVVIAMERGAVLLLDEVDLGSNKIMCLQPVLEGKPIFLKKINKVVHPAPGFTIFATANTKGKGSDDGRFIGTNILNEAFLERFSVTFEQAYPSETVERKILNNLLAIRGQEAPEFTSKLVEWANMIRQSFLAGAITEIISTRRLVHIIQAYVIFGDKAKAVELCLNRFDVETKNAFLSFYQKLEEPAVSTDTITVTAPSDSTDSPF